MGIAPEHIRRSLATVEVRTLRYEVERLRREVRELSKLREEVTALRNAVRLTNGSHANGIGD